MSIRFRCGNCRLKLSVGADRAGVNFQCPKCGTSGVVPSPADAKAQAPPQAPASGSKEAPSPPLHEPAEEEPVRFGNQWASGSGEVDMTPMVDVTFLLLIFFMVTAAYSPQKSIEVPPPDQEESSTQSRTVEEFIEDDDYVIIEIARDNTVWVDEREAPSEQEILVRLREARKKSARTGGRGPSSLLVLADVEARHETVVMCLDAGNVVGMENVRLACADEEAFY